jgi:hypothetical protein
VALVRCDGVERVVERGDPCTIPCANLVTPVATVDRGSGEYQAAEWANQPEDELPKLPRQGTTVSLVPHPHGAAPTLIVGACRAYKAWAGTVLFLFCLCGPGR